jgi:hypothetical protein
LDGVTVLATELMLTMLRPDLKCLTASFEARMSPRTFRLNSL